MKKRTTIKDVAALAGVSCATVSRTLCDRPEISPETKEKVRSACAQLGYVPNAAAKGLTGQFTHTLGVIVTDISSPNFYGMATAIEETAAAHGYRVLLSNSLRDPELEIQAIENFMSRHVDGLLIYSISAGLQARHREIMGDLPYVYLGVDHNEDCSYVMADNEMGGYIGTKYLLDLGHKDILFAGGRPASRTRELRIRGFRRAMQEAGLTGRVVTGERELSFMRQWTIQEALDILSDPLPDAIFAFCDFVALKLMEACRLRGIRIPEDLSLIGFDNIDLAALPRVNLTTVSQKRYRQGALAALRLLDKIGGKEGHISDVLEPELIIRSTCAKKNN